LDLSVDNVKKLDRKMREYYVPWTSGLVRDSEPLTGDQFFLDNQPLTVSYRYGQNSPLGILTHDQEATHFDQSRVMKNIRFFSFSMAAHIVYAFLPIPVVLNIYLMTCRHTKSASGKYACGRSNGVGPLYHDWMNHDRPIDQGDIVASFDPFDQESGVLLSRVYDKSGYEIPWVHFPDHHRVPALFDLNAMRDYFKGGESLEFGSDQGVEGITSVGDKTLQYYPYPLCNLRGYGNFQAHGPMDSVKPFISAINHSINPSPRTGTSAGIQALLPGHCQGYNTISHHFRNQGPSSQDVSLADVTASMAAPYAEGKVAKEKAMKIDQKITNGFPHAKFWLKIQDVSHENLALRLENTYHVDLDGFPKEKRTGR
jgi:hypothetical protein